MTQFYKQFQCVSSQLWKSNDLLVQSTDVLVYILAVTVTALTNKWEALTNLVKRVLQLLTVQQLSFQHPVFSLS